MSVSLCAAVRWPVDLFFRTSIGTHFLSKVFKVISGGIAARFPGAFPSKNGKTKQKIYNAKNKIGPFPTSPSSSVSVGFVVGDACFVNRICVVSGSLVRVVVFFDVCFPSVFFGLFGFHHVWSVSCVNCVDVFSQSFFWSTSWRKTDVVSMLPSIWRVFPVSSHCNFLQPLQANHRKLFRP